MKFGLFGVGSGSTVRPEPLMQVAQKAEALGYESVWIPEHLAVPVSMQTPYPYSADGKFPGGPGAALHDPFVALAFVAACTERIKLGTGVFVLPLRNPLAVAKAVASVSGTTIIGGGDSIAAVKKASVADRITHISTGGGASLEFLGGRTLPGVAVLPDA